LRSLVGSIHLAKHFDKNNAILRRMVQSNPTHGVPKISEAKLCAFFLEHLVYDSRHLWSSCGRPWVHLLSMGYTTYWPWLLTSEYNGQLVNLRVFCFGFVQIVFLRLEQALDKRTDKQVTVRTAGTRLEVGQHASRHRKK